MRTLFSFVNDFELQTWSPIAIKFEIKMYVIYRVYIEYFMQSYVSNC
jgi:hypothetical protein